MNYVNSNACRAPGRKKEMSIMSTSTPHAAARPNHAMFNAARLINPLVIRLAGTRLLPLYGVITHRGRRSGTAFRTPVVVRPIEGGFIVPMPWGESTDWFRNVRAAGSCVIRWKGRDYQMVDPEVLDAQSAMTAFSGSMRAGMSRFGIKQVVRLHFRD
jgi:deazaflavin-dependent oxidoreductase (nitroreductase family)